MSSSREPSSSPSWRSPSSTSPSSTWSSSPAPQPSSWPHAAGASVRALPSWLPGPAGRPPPERRPPSAAPARP
ncbi:hypothetical protein FGL98_16200 [Leekyejoonella antrihumi]|uniref:Uncharacterized protein n=1 Tax=Leekyejoonella antrihumi TaxID=1660198 RepID=A0A563DY64_9MICO|nr:hypothetical protein FGL98_16200 [Leekyejoonella antrihumi]